jgi:hypothetical protein
MKKFFTGVAIGACITLGAALIAYALTPAAHCRFESSREFINCTMEVK